RELYLLSFCTDAAVKNLVSPLALSQALPIGKGEELSCRVCGSFVRTSSLELGCGFGVIFESVLKSRRLCTALAERQG
ncbi:Hypothetical predicted protein, partial [Prunus dulcis]